MATELQDFAFLNSSCGERHLVWAKVHEDNSATVIYLPTNAMTPVEDNIHSLEMIDWRSLPSDHEISRFWREYKSCPCFEEDISKRHPDFRSSFLDWKNRRRAGGWAR